MEEDFEKKKRKEYPTDWKELPTGLKHPTSLKKQKRQNYTLTFFPKKNAIIKLIREHPDNILCDDAGRMYGYMPMNPAMKNYMETSDYDEKTMVEVWVYLPYREAGTFVERSRSEKTSYQSLAVSDRLEFPELDEVIEMYDYLSKRPICSARIRVYLERFTRRSRSAAIVLKVEEIYASRVVKEEKL